MPKPQSREVALHLVRQLKALDADDPQRKRRVFRAFLEAQLQSLFGHASRNDAAFQGLLDRVHLVLEQDPELAASVNRTVETLDRVVGAEDGVEALTVLFQGAGCRRRGHRGVA